MSEHSGLPARQTSGSAEINVVTDSPLLQLDGVGPTLAISEQQPFGSELCVDASAPLQIDAVPDTAQMPALQHVEPEINRGVSTPLLPQHPAGSCALGMSIPQLASAETPQIGPRQLTWDTPMVVRQQVERPGSVPITSVPEDPCSAYRPPPETMLPLLSPATVSVADMPAWDVSPSLERAPPTLAPTSFKPAAVLELQVSSALWYPDIVSLLLACSATTLLRSACFDFGIC